jgi:hypothetical membrane protein
VSSVTERRAGVAGLSAGVVFWIALFAFAAARPDYSHSTKAVSELGVFGAPHAWAWNLTGFIVPGILLALCGAGLASAIDEERKALWWLLVVAGVGFAATGLVPAEMRGGSPLLKSPWTVGHIAASFLSAVPWVIATVLVVVRASRRPEWRHLRAVGSVLALLGVLGLFARALPGFEHRPGLGQRAGFAAYFAWYVVMSLYLLIAPSRSHGREPGAAMSP